MKVELSKVTPEFQPIKLSVTFESREELDIIRTMSSYNESIPKLVGEGREYSIIQFFLNELRDGIDNM